MNTPSSHLLGLFDSEIHRIEADQQRPGWTNWAIVGALGTIAWLLSLEFERTEITWQLASFLLVAVFLVLDFLRDINRLLALSKGSTSPPRIFHLNEFGYHLRRVITLDLFMYAILLVAAISITIQTLPYFKALCVLVFAARVLGGIVSIPLSYTSTPLSTRVKPHIQITSDASSIILDVYLLAAILVALHDMQNVPTVAQARLVVLVAVAFWLVRLLVDSASPHPLLGSLRDVRRSYALGKIDDDIARNQFDRALTGMSVADYTVSEVVQRANKMERDLIDLKADLDRVRRLLRGKLTNNSRELAALIFRSCKRRLAAMQADIAEMHKAADRVPNRMKMLNFITILTINDVTPLLDGMSDTLKALAAPIQSLAATMRSLESNPRFKEIAETPVD